MLQPPARQAGARLEPTTGFLLVRISEAIDRRFIEHLAPLGIRPRHLHVLRQLHAQGSMSQQALADMIRVDPGNLIATLDELQTDGLISREVDPDDRRRRVLQLTAPGVRMLRQGIAASERADDEVLGSLSRAERASLRSAALHVYEHLRRSPQTASQ
jgi:MarR family transcriptional regulator, lower aerobic nicotinate degradation pathway regulator